MEIPLTLSSEGDARRYAFISYSRRDMEFVGKLVRDLEEADLHTWIDARDLQYGDDWQESIRQAIAHANVVLLVATPRSAKSPTVHGEMEQAALRGRRVISLWAEGDNWSDCVPLSMVGQHYLDCRGDSYDTSLSQLTKTLHTWVAPRAPSLPPQLPGEREYTAVLLKYHPLNILLVRFETGQHRQTEWDDEDAEIDKLISYMSTLQAITFVRKRVTSTLELIQVLKNADSEIIHFSGDMKTNTICMSDPTDQGSVAATLSTGEFGRYLGLTMSPRVRVLLLSSCCTLTSSDVLVPYAPYVVAVEAHSVSQAPGLFVKEFYTSYIYHRGVQRAFDEANLAIDARRMLHAMSAAMHKRERHNSDGKLIIEVSIDGLPDPLTIDLSEVESALLSLGIEREVFLRTLATKIQAHRAIFSSPGTNVILSVGSLLHGTFSWDASAGYVRCSRLFRFKGDVNSIQWKEWWRILLAYNALRAEEYRSLARPSEPTARTVVSQAFHRFQTKFLSIKASVDALVRLGYNEADMYFSKGMNYLEEAKDYLELENIGMASTWIEQALTTLHDIVNVTMPPIEGEL